MTQSCPGFSVVAGESIGELMLRLTQALRAVPIDEAYEEAHRLICAAVPVSRVDLLVRPDSRVDAGAATRLEAYAARRIAREPVSRILGSRGFWSFELQVRSNVLDPRGDTERLVEACIALLRGRADKSLRVLDVGTGSGAILAGVLLEFPRATGIGIDLSRDAVECARDNLEQLGLSRRSAVLEQDWRDPLGERFDVVLSNPPYIESDAIEKLDAEVKDHDPRLALDGGPDGLDAYRSIIKLAPSWLKPEALLILEIGMSQSKAVTALLHEGGFCMIATLQDQAGRDRVTHARWRA